MHYHEISDKSLKEFKEICDKQGITYDIYQEKKRKGQEDAKL